MSLPDLTAHDPVVAELEQVRDHLGGLDHAGTGLLDRDTVLAYLRARLDRHVFGADT